MSRTEDFASGESSSIMPAIPVIYPDFSANRVFMSLIHLALSSDDNYVVPTGVTMQSVIANRAPSTRLHFHIMLFEVSAENHRLLESFSGPDVQVSLLDATEADFPNCRVKEGVYWTLPVWFRLRYASFFPELDKVLALDSDMIVREDLTPLWETDVSRVYSAAVPSRQDPAEVAAYLGLPQIKGVCLNPATSLMNLKKFREDNIEQKCFDFLNAHYDRLKFNEEDILNNVLQDQRLSLDERWNLMPMRFYARLGKEKYRLLKQEQEKAAILHFSCRSKPWHGNCEHPLCGEYLKYLAQTPWKNQVSAIRRSRFFNGFWSVTEYPERTRYRLFGYPIVERFRTATRQSYTGGLSFCSVPVFSKTTNFQTGKTNISILGITIR